MIYLNCENGYWENIFASSPIIKKKIRNILFNKYYEVVLTKQNEILMDNLIKKKCAMELEIGEKS